MNKLIVVSGMPHSFTTLLTYLLSQHPSVFLFIKGDVSGYMLENAHLHAGELEPLLDCCKQHDYVLVKKPGVFQRNAEFLLTKLPDAYYICCRKTFEEFSHSSLGHGRLGDDLTANLDKRLRVRQFYKEHKIAENKFGTEAKNFKLIHYKDLMVNPCGVMETLRIWLGLSPHQFDCSIVGVTHVKSLTVPADVPAPLKKKVREIRQRARQREIEWGNTSRKVTQLNREHANMLIEVVQAGVGEGHPHDSCDYCGKKFENKEEEAFATCTSTEYVTLCEKCYRKMGNQVR
jgi:hypothetical protein